MLFEIEMNTQVMSKMTQRLIHLVVENEKQNCYIIQLKDMM